MYGSYGMYSGNKCNFSSSANLYQPAGVINISSSYITPTNNPNNINTNGVRTSNPTVSSTSVVQSVSSNSFQKNTNNSFGVQHIDYQQNPSPVIVSVRQTDNNTAIYTDKNSGIGTYVEQYSLPGVAYTLSTNPNPQTTIYEQQNFNL
jgi:hypothetical protein